MTTERDAHTVLQVDSKAVGEVISAAYRALARQFHPDGPTPDQRRMAEINGAYDRLKTPEARRRYDEDRARGVPVGPARSQPYDPWANAAPVRRFTPDASTIVDFGRYAG